MIDRYLRDHAGLYVVEFPERVKIGMSSRSLRGRLQQHMHRGALRIAAYPTFTPTGYQPPPGGHLGQIEAYALHLADRAGQRIGLSESFTDLTFEQACDLVRAAITARRGGPVHAVDVSLTELAVALPHVSEVIKRRAAARRAVA